MKITFNTLIYTCPYCEEVRQSKMIPVPDMCQACGTVVCRKCKEYMLCPDCIKQIPDEDRPLLKKTNKAKEKNTKKRAEIYKKVFGPKYLLPGWRERDPKETDLMLSDPVAYWSMVTKRNREETYNPDLWK